MKAFPECGKWYKEFGFRICGNGQDLLVAHELARVIVLSDFWDDLQDEYLRTAYPLEFSQIEVAPAEDYSSDRDE